MGIFYEIFVKPDTPTGFGSTDKEQAKVMLLDFEDIYGLNAELREMEEPDNV